MSIKTARKLRSAMTPQEVKLWVHLRSWRERGFHFRRQVPRDGYVLDFACLKHRLIVEADGNQHGFDAHSRRDNRRDSHFLGQGFVVLRFSNYDIDRNLDIVLESIDQALRAASRLPPSPERGERVGAADRGGVTGSSKR